MTAKTAAQLKAGFGSADPEDFLTDLLDSVAGTPDLLPDASATAQGVVELATNAEALTGTATTLAVTPANVRAVMGALKFITLDGVNGAGACTAAGAAVGDIVLGVAGLTGGALGDASASFEAVVTVVNQLQQSDEGDLSGNDYLAVLLAVA